MKTDPWQDRRSSDRVADNSSLVVGGYLDSRTPFEVSGQLKDISLGGISFFLNARVEKDQVLDLTLRSNQGEGLVFRTQARIVRVSTADCWRYRYAVGAEFVGDFVQTGGEDVHQQMAHDLETAVPFDESRRALEQASSEPSKHCEICGTALSGSPTAAKSINQLWCLDCHARLEQAAWERELQSSFSELAL